MNTRKAILILSLAGLGLSSAAFAQQSETATSSKSTTATTVSKSTATKGDRATYRAAKSQANASYKSAKAQCDTMSGEKKADCIGIAKADQKLARANALAQYKPTDKNQMNARLAAAESDYARAKAKCDEAATAKTQQTGTETDVCMSRAAEARNQAIANAKAGKQAAEGKTGSVRGDIGKK